MTRALRDYKLSVATQSGLIEITPNFNIAFSCDKSSAGGLNSLDIDIFGLKESTRLALVKDPEENKKIGIKLEVGYEGQLRKIFSGQVHVGKNARSGSDIITSLTCYDGGYDFFNSFTSKTVTGKILAIDALLADMPNTTIGRITSKITELERPKVLIGNTY